MTKLLWPIDLCAPVIITYNRAQELDQTLSAFAALKDRNLVLHVLDNCSTDDSAQVVAKWQAQWPGLRYHCNPYNIGGNANILRAIELTDKDYVWIIGDDDLWHMDHVEEVITALNAMQADIIRLGWLINPAYAGKDAFAVELFQRESFFFASVSMISATIVRRKIMTRHLNWAYQHIGCSYPQLVPIIRTIQEEPIQVYSVKDPLITHTPSQTPGYFIGDLAWYVAWFRTAQLFNATQDKQRFIAESVRYMIRPQLGNLRELWWLLKVMLNAKAQGVSQLNYLLELLSIGCGWRMRLIALLAIYLCIPKRFATNLRRLYFYLSKKEWKELRYDPTRL